MENFKLLGKIDEDGTIEEGYKEATENLIIATNYIKVQTILLKAKKMISILYIIILIFFFSSIILSSLIAKYLENLDLNCITLWSLLLVLLNTYYKEEFSAKIVKKLKRYYEKI